MNRIDYALLLSDRHPDLDERTVALLANDLDAGYLGGRPVPAVWVDSCESHVLAYRQWQRGQSPSWNGHDGFVWRLSRWLGFVVPHASHEVSIWVDGTCIRADIVLSTVDEEGYRDAARTVIEVKSKIASMAQLRAAAEQVVRYCRGLAQAHADVVPTPVVVCPQIADSLPRSWRGVRLYEPQEFCDLMLKPSLAAA